MIWKANIEHNGTGWSYSNMNDKGGGTSGGAKSLTVAIYRVANKDIYTSCIPVSITINGKEYETKECVAKYLKKTSYWYENINEKLK